MSNTIRKITTLLLAAALLTCSAACSSINGNKDSSTKVKTGRSLQTAAILQQKKKHLIHLRTIQSSVFH